MPFQNSVHRGLNFFLCYIYLLGRERATNYLSANVRRENSLVPFSHVSVEDLVPTDNVTSLW